MLSGCGGAAPNGQMADFFAVGYVAVEVMGLGSRSSTLSTGRRCRQALGRRPCLSTSLHSFAVAPSLPSSPMSMRSCRAFHSLVIAEGVAQHNKLHSSLLLRLLLPPLLPPFPSTWHIPPAPPAKQEEEQKQQQQPHQAAQGSADGRFAGAADGGYCTSCARRRCTCAVRQVHGAH